MIVWGDKKYPESLAQIAWPPPALFVEGDIELLNRVGVAVVGTRRMTAYGEQVTRTFVTGLVERGAVIISGLARGVDAVAHRQTLLMGGKTIAVLAHGLDTTYPPEHARLRGEIVKGGGLIVSEQAPGTTLNKQRLALRNRIVAGLSRCVLVTESPRSSGTKITVGFAADQGKDVYVVPGPVSYPTYLGSVEIMQDGGIPVTGVEQILL